MGLFYPGSHVRVGGRGGLQEPLAWPPVLTIAKELLNGQHVVLVRCEEAVVSGSLIRRKYEMLRWMNKKMLTNPRKGPLHYRAPSRMLWRTIRGMIKHKTARGAAAMERLKVFDGVPPPYDKCKKKVIPWCFRITRLRPGRKFCRVGRLATEVGWKYGELVKKLEEKRSIRGAAFHAKKKATLKLKAKAAASVDLSKENTVLAAAGYA